MILYFDLLRQRLNPITESSFFPDKHPTNCIEVSFTSLAVITSQSPSPSSRANGQDGSGAVGGQVALLKFGSERGHGPRDGWPLHIEWQTKHSAGRGIEHLKTSALTRLSRLVRPPGQALQTGSPALARVRAKLWSTHGEKLAKGYKFYSQCPKLRFMHLRATLRGSTSHRKGRVVS